MYPPVALCEVEAVVWGALEGELRVVKTGIYTYIIYCIVLGNFSPVVTALELVIF